MTNNYEDKYNHTATVRENKNGTATLTIVSSFGKKSTLEYKTIRAAMNGLGRFSDSWKRA